MRLLFLLLLVSNICVAQITSPPMFALYRPAAGATSTNGWLYKRSITVDYTKVGATVADFPMLVAGAFTWLRTEANGGNVKSANGYDLAFFSDAGLTQPLKFERVVWDATTGNVEFWVKVPSVSNSANTVIYIAYGNSAITTDQSDKVNVWTNNYAGVWHMPNGTTLTANDATSNANNGTLMGSPTPEVGVIDGAAGFNGTSQRITLQDHTSLNFTGGSNSFSAWVYPTALNSVYNHIISNEGTSASQGGWTFRLSNGKFGFQYVNGTYGELYSTSTLSLNAWNHIYITTDGINARFYLNGTEDRSLAHTRTPNARTGQKSIGADNNPSFWFAGRIDELRIASYVTRSAGWILTEYNNQNSPSTFYTISAPLAH